MSALDNSYTSSTSSPTRPKRHSLCQQLQQFETSNQNKFNGQPYDLNISKHDTQSESEECNSFILNNNDNNKLDVEPELQSDGLDGAFQKSYGNVNGNPNVGSNNSLEICEDNNKQQLNQSPKTITLISQDPNRQSMNTSSKLSQYKTEVDNQSYSQFLNIRDTTYSVLTKNFQVLFQNISSIYSERIKTIKQTYLKFLKIKCAQEQQYCSVKLGDVYNNKNHVIYIDCKSVTNQILTKIQQEKSKRSVYSKNISILTDKLQKYINTVQQTLGNKVSKIRQIHHRFTEIINQMTDLMIPQTRKIKKREVNQSIYSCSFLRTKYLITKEKLYLSLIASYLERILNFIGFVCLELEPKNCLVVKECLIEYVQAINMFSSNSNSSSRELIQSRFSILAKTNCYQQSYKQICKMLQICIPQALRPYNSTQKPASTYTKNSQHHISTTDTQHSQKQLKTIIQSLISQCQSLVYIPVIQIQQKDFLYNSKNKANVKWIRVNHEQKYKSQTLEQYSTNIILTKQGYLIIQLLDESKNSQEKMAILKLGQIKLSRKNNQIFISDKGKGMIGFLFASNGIIGSLLFHCLDEGKSGIGEQELIQQFIGKVKQILQNKRVNNQATSTLMTNTNMNTSTSISTNTNTSNILSANINMTKNTIKSSNNIKIVNASSD